MTASGSAVVFDIQRFSTDDGPGIRTVVFFKGCTLACAWCHNPESRRRQPELAYHGDRCLPGCRACVDRCPEGALLDRIEGRVRWDACTHCGACVDSCPGTALRMVGSDWSPTRLLDEVLADRRFFAASGGGLTLSGGEPVLHHRFLTGFLPAAKAAGLHVALETAGLYPFGWLESLLPDLDLIYYDLKASGRRHLELVGSPRAPIFANLARLLAWTDKMGPEHSPRIEVRMPVVPGLNDGGEAVAELASKLRELSVESLTLLRYNDLWEAKLPGLDSDQQPLGIHPPHPSYYRELAGRFAERGIRASFD